jgi:A/G-specific adenine glycosylase
MLAAAREETVLGLWSGLGYYQRARNLHAAVREVSAHRQGHYPETAAEMRRLPGVGEYTAAAVASIAFGRPEAVVDGNVTRFLARIFALRGAARSGRLQRECLALARSLLAPRSPGEFNQAMMEAGATVCTPRDPDCNRCPAARDCSGGETPERYPAPAKRRTPLRVRRAAALIHENGRVLLVRVPPGEPNAGMLEPPSVEIASSVDAASALVTGLEHRYGLRIEVREPLGRVRHTITHRRITLELFDARRRSRGPLRPPLRLVSDARLAQQALSAAGRKVLAAL